MTHRTIKEITPAHLRCGIGACPAIFESDDGSEFVIVGKQLGRTDLAATLPSSKVSGDEAAVVISKDLLAALLQNR